MHLNKLFRLGIIFMVPFILIFSQCLSFKKNEDPRGDAYAGSATCVNCHKNIYSSYVHTAHFLSSGPADINTVQGSFALDKNIQRFDAHTQVRMEKRKSGLYQVTYKDGKITQSGRFDLFFGSVKGQSYAYWYANELFQLPISYVANAHQWINSPGYQSNEPDYERMITSQCLGCHMSFAKSQKGVLPLFSQNPEGFAKDSNIYPIDSERCHGPAAEHVKFQTENPEIKEAHNIATYKSLSRDQKVNMCAICHSGANNVMLKATFLFKPGDTLSKFMRVVPSNLSVNYKSIDVHGDQTALLQSSKCYINSSMSCATCHDTHQTQRDNTLLFAARCMTCHTTSNKCKLSNQLNAAQLSQNCISCHMPSFSSKLIIAGESGALVHTHHITVYKDEAQKVLNWLKASNTRALTIH